MTACIHIPASRYKIHTVETIWIGFIQINANHVHNRFKRLQNGKTYAVIKIVANRMGTSEKLFNWILIIVIIM